MSESANNFLDIDQSLIFNYPVTTLMGDINFVQYKSDVASYLPGQTVNFSIRSNNEFMVLDRSYLKFSYAETGNTTTASTISSMGATCFIKQVSDQISGLQLGLVDNFNLIDSVNLSTDTSERKSITQRCQFTSITPGTPYPTSTAPVNNAERSASVSGVARTVCTPIPTTIASANNLIPVLVMSGGWNISYILEDYIKAYVASSASNSYVITNMEIVACMLKPPDEYLQQLSKDLASGKSLKIPLQLTKSYTNLLSTATSQTIRIQPGYLSSLNSITQLYRDAANVGAINVDSFETTIAKFSEFYYNVNSQRFPRNKAIKCSTTDTEFIYQMLASFNTSLSSLSATMPAISDCLHFSWKSNSEFNSGISLNNGELSAELSFASAPTVSDIVSSVLSYDALLVISSDNVQCLTSF